MGTKRHTKNRRVGMWSTISDAVRDGWGATARLIAILAVTSSSSAVAAVLTWVQLLAPQ